MCHFDRSIRHSMRVLKKMRMLSPKVTLRIHKIIYQEVEVGRS